MALYQLPLIPYFCQNFFNGTNQEKPRALVADLFGCNGSFDPCYLSSLGMADADPSIPDYCIGKSNGHHVNLPG